MYRRPAKTWDRWRPEWTSSSGRRNCPEGVRINLRGSVEGMRQSFKSFGLGLLLSIVLVYLILMAQFASFVDPLIILLAIPPGITGVLVFLLVTGTTLNVMSLMGVIMMTGIVVSNSILIVDVTRIYRRQGMPIREAVALACRVRLRPILMTSLATILGLIPMALALEAGSEQYAPLARSIIGGLTVSVVVTVFLVPAAYSADSPQRRAAAIGGAGLRRKILQLVVSAMLGSFPLAAQTSSSANVATQQAAPAAPGSSPPQMQTIPAPPQLPTGGAPQRLTVQDAEALALKNNPQISVYRLLALASQQMTREQKSAYYPNLYGSLTAVKPKENSRIAAGNLNNPIVFERAAGGLTLSQLITDFGRTNNLVATAALRAKAADMNAAATADQIKLAVDQAFYNALQTVALLRVAEQTVKARQLVSDQITTLFNNKLRSQLDVSFANVNLAQAKLLLLDAQNNQQAALSALSEILGYTAQQQVDLVDSEAELKPPPDSVTQLQDQAFSNRPEIASQDYEYQAAQHFQKAERDVMFPSVEALGVVGRTPYSNSIAGVSPFTSWYGAVGVNVNIPIFNGFLYPARSQEAAVRAQASGEQLRDLKDRIANDVRTSWLNAITAYNRISVTKQFVDQANLAVNLSETRYNLGLSSIVELSQAQLQQTEAQIQFAAAKYQYQIAQSVLRFQVAAP